MTKPIERDHRGDIVALSPLRRRRLLQATGWRGFNHKPFFEQYSFLGWEGLTIWTLGHAVITEKGEAVLRALEGR